MKPQKLTRSSPFGGPSRTWPIVTLRVHPGGDVQSRTIKALLNTGTDALYVSRAFLQEIAVAENLEDHRTCTSDGKIHDGLAQRVAVDLPAFDTKSIEIKAVWPNLADGDSQAANDNGEALAMVGMNLLDEFMLRLNVKAGWYSIGESGQVIRMDDVPPKRR